ncbi:hypothetical protein HanXRQr2_Chr12g0543001 [Helianthus annuus]|uniref:Uncharacterized protein n=1 Tax=Helianthus annuus TaxID=4232 RepID=A0A9K3HGQ9_HELAN|nr:hypothetical protein HanXRQr2_Chr12g0543001 [Helianthus annuus]
MDREREGSGGDGKPGHVSDRPPMVVVTATVTVVASRFRSTTFWWIPKPKRPV